MSKASELVEKYKVDEISRKALAKDLQFVCAVISKAKESGVVEVIEDLSSGNLNAILDGVNELKRILNDVVYKKLLK